MAELSFDLTTLCLCHGRNVHVLHHFLEPFSACICSRIGLFFLSLFLPAGAFETNISSTKALQQRDLTRCQPLPGPGKGTPPPTRAVCSTDGTPCEKRKMNAQTLVDPECWANHPFGPSERKDIRRTSRAVHVACNRARNPSGSLPGHLQTWNGTIALSRLLSEEDVTLEALMQPHGEQTREQIEAWPVVVLVQDTTDVDLSHHPMMSVVGQIGSERGGGLYLQTAVARVPETGEVLGCAMQEPFVRTPAPAGETRSKRRQRTERETDVWMRLVTRLGRFPAEMTVVQIGDREAGSFSYAGRRRPLFGCKRLRTDGSSPKRGRKPLCSTRCEPGRSRTASPSRCQARMDERLAGPWCNSPGAL